MSKSTQAYTYDYEKQMIQLKTIKKTHKEKINKAQQCSKN